MTKRPALKDTDTCPTCGDEGLVTCTHENTGRDADGWCTECDAPTDEPGRVMCECIN